MPLHFLNAFSTILGDCNFFPLYFHQLGLFLWASAYGTSNAHHSGNVKHVHTQFTPNHGNSYFLVCFILDCLCALIQSHSFTLHALLNITTERKHIHSLDEV